MPADQLHTIHCLLGLPLGASFSSEIGKRQRQVGGQEIELEGKGNRIEGEQKEKREGN